MLPPVASSEVTGSFLYFFFILCIHYLADIKRDSEYMHIFLKFIVSRLRNVVLSRKGYHVYDW